jgi:hypothetical protein
MEFDFEEIRPYNDQEIHDAIIRIAEAEPFYAAMQWLFPEQSKDEIRERIMGIYSTYEFQKQFMHVGIRKIVEKTSDGLSCDGFENIDKHKGYLYVSNHRDIFLDSGLLQILLFEKEIDTTQITFGSNLMQGVMVDMGRINKMFKVDREGSIRELYESSQRLSAYIRQSITKQNDSIWIAQRNGRTKDGHDLTQTGVLKMFSQSGTKNFVDCFCELNLAPMAISYEYEPCDYSKTQELYMIETTGSYEKQPGEDLNSIIKGIQDYKGRIHLAITPLITQEEIIEIDKIEGNFNKKIEKLTAVIDGRIYSSLKLWPTNYIAADLLTNTFEFDMHYSVNEKSSFIENMNSKLDLLKGERSLLQEIFLKIYANPLLDKTLNSKK